MSRLADEMRKTFASMHVSRNFRLFFVGQLISVTGTWVNWTAGAVLVLELTDSGVALGIEAALLFLPVLLFGVYAGSLADRFDKRRILVWSNAGYALLAALQFTLVATGVVEIWMVFVIAFLTGLILAIEPPTRQSFYVELVGEEHITNAISLNSAVFTGTRVLGGAIAGTMIDTFGLWSPFLLDAISYVGVIAALLAMRIHELHPQRKAEREPGLVRAGLRYVWSSRELRVPLVVMALVYLFTFNFSVVIPLQAHRTYRGSGMEIGWLYAALGLGAFLGAIAMANRQTEPTLRRLAGFSIAFGAFLAVAGWAPTFVVGLIAMVPVGYASMLFAITANSTLQRFTRADMRGRVMALYTTIFLGSSAIGGPIAGWVAEFWGAPEAIVASGAIAAGAGLFAVRARDTATASTEIPTADTAARSA
ncbi:MAG: major facilitator superfamily 1 [Actinomycetia bacterium]|nr:major facilitator superfamily 1 [Actinomycetes bacterium]